MSKTENITTFYPTLLSFKYKCGIHVNIGIEFHGISLTVYNHMEMQLVVLCYLNPFMFIH